MNRWRIVLIAVGALIVSACGGEVLYSNLDEGQANEIVSTLRAKGLKAKKDSRGGRFRVSTSSQDFVMATDILNRAGLPRRVYHTTDSMFEGGNLVPIPSEQKIREEYARAQDLEKTLEEIEGVAHASVHISLPDAPRLNQEPEEPTASVIIHHYVDVDISTFRTDIKTLVANAIEGLTLENTSVVFFTRNRLETNSSVLPSAGRGTQGLPPARLGLGIGLALLTCLIGGILWILWSRRTVVPSHAQAIASNQQVSLPEEHKDESDSS